MDGVCRDIKGRGGTPARRLLERAIYPVSSGGIFTTILVFLPMTLLPMLFHFYSYLFFLHGLLDFFFLGAIRSWRLAKEAEASEMMDGERQAIEEKLDAQERVFNALDGQGPFTDAEALGRGSLSTEEFVKGQMAREQELDKK